MRSRRARRTRRASIAPPEGGRAAPPPSARDRNPKRATTGRPSAAKVPPARWHRSRRAAGCDIVRTMTTGASDPGGSARPEWVPHELYAFESRYADVAGARVHYLDEGTGRPLLLLHGNPTWSFLYRNIITGLRDRYRCIAPDHPGFGLSRAAPGYGYTPREHAAVLEKLVLQLDLSEVTMMVQDWGGPIGFAVATRHPSRFAAFLIGNTWPWPKSDLGTQLFSRLLGGPIGGYLILQRNFFVEKIVRGKVKRQQLSGEVMN